MDTGENTINCFRRCTHDLLEVKVTTIRISTQVMFSAKSVVVVDIFKSKGAIFSEILQNYLCVRYVVLLFRF